jgi:hypothetical protein
MQQGSGPSALGAALMLLCPVHAGGLALGKQLVVLLSADSAAMGLWSEGLLLRHKVLTGYTTRWAGSWVAG